MTDEVHEPKNIPKGTYYGKTKSATNNETDDRIYLTATKPLWYCSTCFQSRILEPHTTWCTKRPCSSKWKGLLRPEMDDHEREKVHGTSAVHFWIFGEWKLGKVRTEKYYVSIKLQLKSPFHWRDSLSWKSCFDYWGHIDVEVNRTKFSQCQWVKDSYFLQSVSKPLIDKIQVVVMHNVSLKHKRIAHVHGKLQTVHNLRSNCEKHQTTTGSAYWKLKACIHKKVTCATISKIKSLLEPMYLIFYIQMIPESILYHHHVTYFILWALLMITSDFVESVQFSLKQMCCQREFNGYTS